MNRTAEDTTYFVSNTLTSHRRLQHNWQRVEGDALYCVLTSIRMHVLHVVSRINVLDREKMTTSAEILVGSSLASPATEA